MRLINSSVLLTVVAWMFLLADRATTVASALQQQQQPSSSRGQQQRAVQQQRGAPPAALIVCDRRSALFRGILATTMSTATAVVTTIPQLANARAPGSKDVNEAIQQIRDAAIDLRKLEGNWEQVALIDQEGRAVTDATVIARRVLGGVAPLAGASAIEVAKLTPLYRIDGAFNVIRKACIETESDSDWSAILDLEVFEELVERILFQIQKADGDLYSVAFASKGTKQISGIYKEAKGQIDQGIVDLEKMIRLLSDAGAPGL